MLLLVRTCILETLTFSVGHNMMVAHHGSFVSVDGTSASAPVFSGVVTLLDTQLLAAGLPRLGFLNPVLYAAYAEYPDAFYDVTAGNNRCGAYDSDPVCCDYGYPVLSVALIALTRIGHRRLGCCSWTGHTPVFSAFKGNFCCYFRVKDLRSF